MYPEPGLRYYSPPIQFPDNGDPSDVRKPPCIEERLEKLEKDYESLHKICKVMASIIKRNIHVPEKDLDAIKDFTGLW